MEEHQQFPLLVILFSDETFFVCVQSHVNNFKWQGMVVVEKFGDRVTEKKGNKF